MAFDLSNHTISYGKIDVIHSINLQIKKGEKIALLGRSGSGKSTLIKNLFEQQKQNASYIPQELGLVQNLSVFHNTYIANLDKKSLFYNIRNLIFPAKIELKKIISILKQIVLEDKIFSKVSSLSGGEKQRVAIARVLLDKKSILLADEPISALDEQLSKIVMIELSENFKTVVCALHNVDIAIEHFDRVIGLNNGHVMLDKKSENITLEDRKALYDVCL